MTWHRVFSFVSAFFMFILFVLAMAFNSVALVVAAFVFSWLVIKVSDIWERRIATVPTPRYTAEEFQARWDTSFGTGQQMVPEAVPSRITSVEDIPRPKEATHE